MALGEIATKYTSEKSDRETESIRHFHRGPLRRCSRCGRKVFLPCLACATELEGDVNDPLETTEEESIRIQLDGDHRRRYEFCRLEKITQVVRREESEEALDT